MWTYSFENHRKLFKKSTPFATCLGTYLRRSRNRINERGNKLIVLNKHIQTRGIHDGTNIDKVDRF